MTTFLPFSEKGLASIESCEFLTVWEGAVRSAKTICSVKAFLDNVILSKDLRHLMTGRSQAAVLANCIDGEYGFIELSGGLAKIKRDDKNESYLAIFNKRIDIFGGENISSFKAFRGRSYGSAYNDEANLQHPNTIAESFNRTIAAKNRRHFMTLNPDNPNHWLYRDYLDKFRDDSMPGYRWWHFTLDDNPAISEERKGELKAQYTGFNYRRFILGERARAEGQCTPSFVRNTSAEEPGNVLFEQPKIKRVTFGIDFGGHKSATVFICTGWYSNEGKKLCLVTLAYKKLLHTKKAIGPTQLNAAWFQFQKDCRKKWPADRAFCDSAEQVLKQGLNQIPGSLRVSNAMKREINERIRAADALYAQGRKNVMAGLEEFMDAIENAIWNDKKDVDERLDDGSSDIDSLDADEYSWERDISLLIGG